LVGLQKPAPRHSLHTLVTSFKEFVAGASSRACGRASFVSAAGWQQDEDLI
jgi:hypothetical protein